MSETKNIRPPNTETVTISASTEVKTRRFKGPNSAFIEVGGEEVLWNEINLSPFSRLCENEMGY
jgi:hypothetical protein